MLCIIDGEERTAGVWVVTPSHRHGYRAFNGPPSHSAIPDFSLEKRKKDFIFCLASLFFLISRTAMDPQKFVPYTNYECEF